MEALLQLSKYGQSYWLDNLTRRMLLDGSLQRRVREQGLRGVTSNPAIFYKSIASGTDYDDQIRQLVQEGKEIHEIYEALVVSDVRQACDLLRPVYDETEGGDGYVSLEVSPYLAHDTAGTMAEVRRLWQAVDRPNVFIKIPGTPAGVPAIEAMLYEGININITLLFAVEDYEAVAEAYLRALERRVAEGKPVHRVASVASFFLSRIDVLVDQLLGQRIRPGASDHAPRAEQLLGKVAIASAKMAYQSFKRLFSGPRWQALAAQGARVQRPLWASTSTKNPLYSDVYYVEPLIGPHTVNTMPEETIAAFADHGVVRENTIEADLEEAHETLRALEQVGIDLAQVTQQLQNEGVQKFIEPFDALMRTLAQKRDQVLGDAASRQRLAPGAVRAVWSPALAVLDSQQFTRRLYARDPFLWTRQPAVAAQVRQRLGWLDSPAQFRARLDELTAFAREVQEAGFRHVVLLGMGGSSLCPEVCRDVFGAAPGWPPLLVLDNTDPAAVRDLEAQVDLARTLFLVASKSGTTTETLCFYRYFWEQVQQRTGAQAGAQFVAITDPGTPLQEEARRRGFRRCFVNPPDIGGRYAALSYFGLVPMALLGMDVAAVLARAQQLRVASGPFVPADTNPGVSLGVLLAVAARHGRDKVTLVLDEPLRAFGAWAEQLLAESTGKEGRGLVPVDGEPLGAPEVYGPDRVFVALRLATTPEAPLLDALEAAGHPVVRLVLPTALDLGGEFFRWELATATAGALLGVNAFDEPNVAESKDNTRRLLAAWQQRGDFAEGKPLASEEGVALFGDATAPWLGGRPGSVREALQRFVAQARPPDYLAFLPYVRRTAAFDAQLQALRRQLRDRLRVATTVGYGPRYLHSTGQLHKGGPKHGLFLLMTAEATADVPIPGEPYGFAALQRAQALGDWQALQQRGLRVLRLHLGADPEAGLQRVAAWLV